VFHSTSAIRWSELGSFDWLVALVSKAGLLSSIAKVGSLVNRCPLKRDQLDVPSSLSIRRAANAASGSDADFQHGQFRDHHLDKVVKANSSRRQGLVQRKQSLPRFSFRPVAAVAWIPSA
jgi:hypothetical protein